MKKIIALFLALVMTFSLSLPAFSAAEAEKPFENSEFFTYEDYTVHYRSFLPEKEQKGQIFLLHGFCLSTVSLEGVAREYAAKGYRVVLADVPNFGYSSRESRTTSLLDRETVLYALVEELGGKWIAGGHSMGGGIAINLATAHPESFTGLILFAPQTSAEVTGISSMLMRSGFMKIIYTLVLKLALTFPFVVRFLVETSFSDKAYADGYDLSRITDPFTLPGSAEGVAMMASHTRGSDLEAFSRLEMPCVILTAEDDRVANAENLQAIIDNAPKDTRVIGGLEGGHMMMEYNPVLAAELTLEVIK